MSNRRGHRTDRSGPWFAGFRAGLRAATDELANAAHDGAPDVLPHLKPLTIRIRRLNPGDLKENP